MTDQKLDISKLPIKWQEYIRNLYHEKATLEEQITRLRGVINRTILDTNTRCILKHPDSINLPMNTAVEFRIKKNIIRVNVHEEMLRIMADNRMVVQPEASNFLYLQSRFN